MSAGTAQNCELPNVKSAIQNPHSTIDWLLAISFVHGSFAIMPLAEGKYFLPGYDQALESVKAAGLLMANLVSRNFGNARSGLDKGEEDFCAAVMNDDKEVDLLEKQVHRA